MKKQLRKFVLIIGPLVFLLFIYLQFGQQLKVYYVSHSFLKSMVQQNFDSASKYISFTSAKKEDWTHKAQEAKQKGTKLIDYRNIETRTNDGYYFTVATLEIEDNGSKTNEKVFLHFRDSKISGVELFNDVQRRYDWMTIFEP
ncbi:hypothetical protein [Paenibacillus sp. QZ-Y1]|uniref:hypothetical protein n=1 Tax=Paenibacillus sp. QZ-Y1 TaxID=3414511 RepID=UPI003F79EEFA